MDFNSDEFRKTAKMFDPMVEGSRSKFDDEVEELEKELSFEEMFERQRAEKLYTKAQFGSRELTLEEKQLLVKWNLATFTGDTETEFGKFELIAR